MTPEHKQSILPQIEEFWKLDIDKRVAETYKDFQDFQDLTTVYIGYYSVTEFTEFSKKAIGAVRSNFAIKII
ncbi:hypothetical protein EKL32_22655 [Flavobacterium sp. GSN2]|nr:hypothetical protein EKL32_22655 [Flavobacterium sp. GSN2]